MKANTTPFLTVAQVARLLRRTPGRVYQMIQAGELPATMLAGRRVVPLEAWETWVKAKVEAALAAVADRAAAGCEGPGVAGTGAAPPRGGSAE